MIDILPYNQKKRILRLRHMRTLTGFFAGAIVLIAVSLILFIPTLETINARYTLATTQTRKLEQSGAITKDVDVAGLMQRVTSIKDALDATTTPFPMSYMQQIQVYEKNGIQIKGYMFTDASKPIVEVHGVATTREKLQAFLTNLQSDPAIESVDSPISNFVKSTDSEFVITVTFKTP